MLAVRVALVQPDQRTLVARRLVLLERLVPTMARETLRAVEAVETLLGRLVGAALGELPSRLVRLVLVMEPVAVVLVVGGVMAARAVMEAHRLSASPLRQATEAVEAVADQTSLVAMEVLRSPEYASDAQPSA